MSWACRAQNIDYKFYNYSTENGLPTNSIQKVYQDSYGFLWLASFDGLFRWDGYNIKKYTHSEKDPQSIDNNIIYSIFEDSEKRLWVGTIEGLNLYNREKDVFSKCLLKSKGERIPVNDILEDSAHQLWLGTSKGLCKYEINKKRAQWFVRKAAEDVVFCMAKDKDNNLWLGTYSEGVEKFDPRTNTLRIFKNTASDQNLLSANNIKSILVDKNNKVWVGTDKGITVLNDDGTVLRKYEQFFVEPSSSKKIINCLYEDKKGTLWIGVSRERLYAFNHKNTAPVPVTTPAQNQNQEQLASISSICEDRFGNTWFASIGNGLFYTNSKKNVFHSHLNDLLQVAGLDEAVITSFCQENKTNMWMGTNGDGLLNYSRDHGTTTMKKVPLLDGLAINDVQWDRDGALWLATWGGGVKRYDPRSGTLISFMNDPAKSNSLISNDVKALLVDDSVLYVGTHGEGLAIYNFQTGSFHHHRNAPNWPFSLHEPAWINHLFKDSRKRIWISTYSGVYKMEGMKLTHYEHSKSPSTICSNSVNMVVEDRKGKIWMITERGLDLYDDQTNGFQRLTEKYGLPESMKSGVVDDHNVLWIASNEGILSFDPASSKINRYGQNDGLHENSFFQKSVYKATDGQLFFGSPKGFESFNPSSLKPLNIPSSFYFTDLYIYNELQRPSQKGSPIDRSLSLIDTLVLEERQSFFSVGFMAINLYAPNKIKYAYLLEGLHDQWLEVQDERKVSFTNLPPGQYVLKVKYTNADGQWEPGIKSLHIMILPPWWKTLAFKIAVVLIIISGIVTTFYLRVAAIRHRNKVLEEEVKKRTHELSEMNASLIEQNDEIKQQKERIELSHEEIVRQSNKILDQQQHIIGQNQSLEKAVAELEKINVTKDHFFSILAHDLKSPVSALADLLEYLKHNLLKMEKQALQEYLNSMHASSTAVYELLVNLLNWSRTQSGNIKHAPANWSMAEILEKNVQLLEPQFNKKNISLEVNMNRAHWIFADFQMVDAMIRNLLSNSVKFTDYNGRVSVHSLEEPEYILVRIEDNGIGMSEDQVQGLFSLERSHVSAGTAGEKGTGLGLLLIKEFLSINQGQVSVESTPGKGSCFCIRLPKSKIRARQQVKNRPAPEPNNVEPHFWSSIPVDRLLKIKGKKLLIVDDNKELRNYLKLELSETFEIFEAENGLQGLEVARDILPAIIIADLLMPAMSGLDFCKQIKVDTATSHIPVIILTSQWEEKIKVSAYEAGADVFLTKPVQKQLLIQVVLNCLANQERLHAKVFENILTNQPLYPESAVVNKSDEEFLKKLVTYIESNISDINLDARLLAKEMAISRTVLYSKLKTLTGQSVHEFIKSIRLRKSVTLLLEGKLSINQIAFEVGFNSHSYFDRCFAKQYGTGPKEFLKRKGRTDIVYHQK